MAKSYAARYRGDEKDYYDLVHVLLFNRAGGPEQAATQLIEGPFRDDVRAARSIFLETEARFGKVSDYGAQSYARQALRVQPDADPTQLAQDAVSAIAESIAALDLVRSRRSVLIRPRSIA